MVCLPALSFSVYESGTNASSTWPTAIYFPKVSAGVEFSIENALPKWPTLNVVFIDLSQLMQVATRVVH